MKGEGMIRVTFMNGFEMVMTTKEYLVLMAYNKQNVLFAVSADV